MTSAVTGSEPAGQRHVEVVIAQPWPKTGQTGPPSGWPGRRIRLTNGFVNVNALVSAVLGRAESRPPGPVRGVLARAVRGALMWIR